MEVYVLNRIESDYAVLEDNNCNTINIPLKKLKGEIREGNMYSKDKEYFIFNKMYTVKRKNKMNNITKSMWE